MEGKGLSDRELAVVEVLCEHPNGLGFNELARMLKDVMSRPTLSKVVERLKNRKLIIVDEESWRIGRKKIIHLNPEFSHGITLLLKTVREARWKALYIIKASAYMLDKRIMKFEDFINTYAEILINLLIATIPIMHSSLSKEYREAVGSVLLNLIVEIVDEIIKMPKLKDIIDYSKYVKYGLPINIFEDIDEIYKQTLEKAKELGIDEDIRRELSSREKKLSS